MMPDEYARRIEILLSHRLFDQARSAIDEAEHSSFDPVDAIGVGTALAAIDLPPRVVGILSHHGIDTVGDALRLSPDQLRSIPGVGPESVYSIITTLRESLVAIESAVDA